MQEEALVLKKKAASAMAEYWATVRHWRQVKSFLPLD
jgi:hypothetical protein